MYAVLHYSYLRDASNSGYKTPFPPYAPICATQAPPYHPVTVARGSKAPYLAILLT
jgi:hypothetical protein